MTRNNFVAKKNLNEKKGGGEGGEGEGGRGLKPDPIGFIFMFLYYFCVSSSIL